VSEAFPYLIRWSHPHTKNICRGTTTFDILREAFWPGDIVIKEEPRKLRTYRLTDVQYHKHFYPPPPKRSLQISAEYIDCNGDDFGTVKTTFEIDEFSGIRFINQLDLFPLKYHPDQDTIRQRLLERGKKFVTLKGQHYKMYQGLAKDQKTGTTRLVSLE
jgi:hypothetical protein